MTLVAIGGAEDKTGDMTVLKRVLAEAAIKNPRVLVITTATAYPEEVANKYRTAFARLNVAPDTRHITTKAEADAPASIASLQHYDVVFFSGGDQEKLSATFGGTAFLSGLIAREKEGMVVAGTSAGAAAMSKLMITGGEPRNALKPGGLGLGEGLSFTPDIVFDTHFNQRHRLKRLFGAAAADSRKTGIGLDEDTGVVVKNGTYEVVGSGRVTVLKDGVVTRHKHGDSFSL
jgi:cyanophycinase